MKILGCPHLWIIWLITQGVILLYLLTAYTVSIASRPFCQVKEMLEAPEVIRRKQDDHHASHSNGVNQFLHLLSSSTLYLLLHPRVLRSHHSDVFGSGCAFCASVGVFYGDRFDHQGPWCRGVSLLIVQTSAICRHAALHLGFFLVVCFPHDDWYLLPLLETGYYTLSAYFER